ncbi:MAG: hypothetical protein MGG11_12390 [Trichodesmium sp. MAG_R03]|nr:hypothetical protein [Trichodesmium sp. MAG_R03]
MFKINHFFPMKNTQLQLNKPWLGRLKTLIASTFLFLSFLTIEDKYAISIDNCQSPASNEYLLIILTETPANQDVLRRSLPPDIRINICRYIDQIVSSIRGFDDKDVASDWARYIQDIVGLNAYVVKPREETKSINQCLPASPEIGLNPQLLGDGYAVLVDYNNQSEIALQLQKILGRNLGLAAYRQKHFLLVTYTKESQAATDSMLNLSNRGFLTFVVDSRKVTLIRAC